MATSKRTNSSTKGSKSATKGTSKGVRKPSAKTTIKKASEKVTKELDEIKTNDREAEAENKAKSFNWMRLGLWVIGAFIVYFLVKQLFKPNPDNQPDPKAMNYELENQRLKDTLLVLKASKVIDSVTLAKEDSVQRHMKKKDTAWAYLIKINQIKKAELKKQVYETIPAATKRLSHYDDSIIRAYTTF